MGKSASLSPALRASIAALAAAGIAALGGFHAATLVLVGAGAALAGCALLAGRRGRRIGTEDDTRTEQAERRLLDAIPTSLIVLDINGRLVHANPVARQTLPQFPDDALHSSVLRAPEWVEAVTASLADRQARQVSFVTNPGRARVLEARLAPLEDDTAMGTEGGLVIQIEDRTEAQRAVQLRSDFVANASHELRTPLASIIGYIETLQNHARNDAGARERFLAIMAREAARMQRLVDDLMSLSRIEMAEHVRPEKPCILAEIAANAATALRPAADAAGVTLDVALPDESSVVRGDADQLHQVFSNLIGNAIQYAGQGATVRVATAAASPSFPGRVGVTVSDTGPGIARDDLPRLTERFYRARVGTSRRAAGTGLGLAIVKHILNRHEGRLEIASTPGKGSAFTVWLPRHDQ